MAVVPAPPPPPRLDVKGNVAKARAVAVSHGPEVYTVLDLASRRVDDHFAARLARIDTLCDELFSARWKWRATFWSDAEYEKALRRRVEGRLFDGLPALLDAIQRDVVAAAEASDNRMIAEVGETVRGAAPSIDTDALRVDYRAELGAAVVRDAEMNLVSLAVSDVVASVVMSSLAVSGVFGPAVAAGAATSWWSVGIGVAVAIVVAIVVDAIVGGAFETEARTRLWSELSTYRMEAMRRVHDAVAGALRRYVESREEAVAKAAEKNLVDAAAR